MNVVVFEPLATRVKQQPQELFTILARIVVRAVEPAAADAIEADLAAVYDEALGITQRVRAILRDFERASLAEGAFTNVTASAQIVLAPFARARVAGADLAAVVGKLASEDATSTVEISGYGESNARHPDFDPRILASRVIAEPLASNVVNEPDQSFDVIVQLNTRRIADRAIARENLKRSIRILDRRTPGVVVERLTQDAWHSYAFLNLCGEAIAALVELDSNPATGEPAIFRVWEDSEVRALIVKSIATIKADAAQSAYSATGADIVWAVLDSGIDAAHPHFRHFANLAGLPNSVRHRDFTGGNVALAPTATVGTPELDDASAVSDAFGHGTHVAGIIAGIAGSDTTKFGDARITPTAIVTNRDEANDMHPTLLHFEIISGMAPQCKLVSYKVLDDSGIGATSAIIEALVDIRKINELAGKMLVHGVNLSVGYTFDAEWFGCGASPLCQEVDRLVRSGVIVVCAAGNSGYGKVATNFTGYRSEGLGMSINDPGNAELAITVGSVHRDSPHTYGVSYFSSKGPTGDGRRKPDLVAPGEKIISCASTQSRTATTVAVPTTPGGTPTGARAPNVELDADAYQYKEDSGTSMAAPHVSGAIAGFLSIRREYVGKPELVKALFMENATDLRRDPTYQGAGLIDQMRVISSV